MNLEKLKNKMYQNSIYTVRELSKRTGIKESRAYSIMSGRHSIKMKEIEIISSILNLNKDEIIEVFIEL